MFTYLISVSLLILAYFTYGKYLERNFGIDDRPTPVTTHGDGVDFVPIKWGRALLIQFLNIAGLGPVAGAMAGALWGTASFVWIVLGCIFIGALHDYYSGTISMRHNGENIPNLIGYYLGPIMKCFSEFIILVLLIVVGVAFVTGPAEILQGITSTSVSVWVIIISFYYLAATILPIDKIIGRIYPFFGAALIIMGFLLMWALITKGYSLPELSLKNMHPKGTPIIPFLFVVVSCGAVSGFHSTQSVLMGRCIKSEFYARKAFYGAMIVEGIVALTWASMAIAFFGGTEGLAASGGGIKAINTISTTLLGPVGAILSIIAVVTLPISTGDTAFRSARLVIADFLKFDQKPIKNRFLIAIPLFILAGVMSKIGFNQLWVYVAVTNQIFATITLWMITFYLIKYKKNFLVSGIPTAFMTGVMIMFVLMDQKVGFRMTSSIPYYIGSFVGIIIAIFFIVYAIFKGKNSVQKINL